MRNTADSFFAVVSSAAASIGAGAVSSTMWIGGSFENDATSSPDLVSFFATASLRSSSSVARLYAPSVASHNAWRYAS